MNSGFEVSKHAKEQAIERGIPLEIIFDVLENPDKIIQEDAGQLVYQKSVSFTLTDSFLVRVFVNSLKDPNLVKTVYRTSKYSKYK